MENNARQIAEMQSTVGIAMFRLYMLCVCIPLLLIGLVQSTFCRMRLAKGTARVQSSSMVSHLDVVILHMILEAARVRSAGAPERARKRRCDFTNGLRGIK